VAPQAGSARLCNNSAMVFRYAAATIIGAVLFVFYFQPFLPYAQRGQLSSHWWPFPVIELICCFVLGLGRASRRFAIPTCLLLTLFAANAFLIVADAATGDVDHNLFPIEFLFIVLLASPAYLGALFSAAVDRLRARGMIDEVR